eukprot:scaffold39105_cov76-Phaeocystis_antarctica.AAC.3
MLALLADGLHARVVLDALAKGVREERVCGWTQRHRAMCVPGERARVRSSRYVHPSCTEVPFRASNLATSQTLPTGRALVAS